MKKNNLNNEYKRHVKRNFIPLFITGLFFTLIIILTFSLLTRGLVFDEMQYKTVSSKYYDYIVESSNNNYYKNSYYKINSLVTCENLEGEIIHSNAYMDLECLYDEKSPLFSDELEDREIIISKKIANKLEVDIGSFIYLHLFIYNTKVEYKIIDIIEYVDDYYDFEDDDDFSVFKIGYNPTIISGISGHYVSFLSNDEMKDYYDKNISHSNIYQINSELDVLLTNIILFNALLFVSYVSLCIAYVIFSKRKIDIELRKYFINGYGYKQTKNMAFLDYSIWIIVPIISTIIVFGLLCSFSKFSFILFLSMTIFAIIIILSLLWRVGKQYE